MSTNCPQGPDFDYPVTLHHTENGEITKVWRNPNLFVTADDIPDDGSNARDPIYTPLSGKLDDETDYYYVADVFFNGHNGGSSSSPVVEFYFANPAGGITPDELQHLGTSKRGRMGVDDSFQLISQNGQNIAESGHLCLIAWIRTDDADPNADQTYCSSIPTKPNGCVDAAHPLVAQRNISVVDVPPKTKSTMFDVRVPEGVNEIVMKREPIAENEDLMATAGIADVENEAAAAIKVEVFVDNRSLPIATFTPEELEKGPTIDMKGFPNTALHVRTELADNDDNRTAGAIFTFETPDRTEGVAMVMAFNQEDADAEEKKAEQETPPWFKKIEKRFGKRRAEMMRERFERRRKRARG